MDQDWRALERRLEADPGDGEAVRRAVAARRRAGMPVPLGLLERVTSPARTIASDVALDVWITRPGGEHRWVGATGGPAAVQVPEHIALWVQPRRGTPIGRAIEAARDHELPGLVVAAHGPLERRRSPQRELAALAELSGLTWLRLEGWSLRGSSLRPLGALTGLNHLSLSSCRSLFAGGLRSAALERLVSAELWRCGSLQNTGLEALTRLPGLARLALVGQRVTDTALRTLIAPAPELEALDLAQCNEVRLPGVQALREAPRLRRLGLSQCTRADAEWCEALALLPALEQLDLSMAIAIEEGALRRLAAAPGLRRLDLRGVELREGELAALAAFPALESLDLRGPSPVDPGRLARLTGLRRVALHRLAPDAQGPWPPLRALSMTLGDCASVDDDARLELAARLAPDLEELALEGPRGPGERGVAAIAGLKRLARLTVHAQPMYARPEKAAYDLRWLEPLAALERLDEVTITGLSGVTTPRLARLLAQAHDVQAERPALTSAWRNRGVV